MAGDASRGRGTPSVFFVEKAPSCSCWRGFVVMKVKLAVMHRCAWRTASVIWVVGRYCCASCGVDRVTVSDSSTTVCVLFQSSSLLTIRHASASYFTTAPHTPQLRGTLRDTTATSTHNTRPHHIPKSCSCFHAPNPRALVYQIAPSTRNRQGTTNITSLFTWLSCSIRARRRT